MQLNSEAPLHATGVPVFREKLLVSYLSFYHAILTQVKKIEMSPPSPCRAPNHVADDATFNRHPVNAFAHSLFSFVAHMECDGQQ